MPWKECRISFTVHAKPISINKAYRSIVIKKRGKVWPSAILTSVAKKYKDIVGRSALVAMTTNQLRLTEAPMSIRVCYYFETRRGDVDNYSKPIFDGMKGVVFKDDSQIGDNTNPNYQELFHRDSPYTFSAEFVKCKDAMNPRTEIDLVWFEKTEDFFGAEF